MAIELYEHNKIAYESAVLMLSETGKLPPVPLKCENVCALSIIESRTINVDDVYECSDYDFLGPKTYDKETGYPYAVHVSCPL